MSRQERYRQALAAVVSLMPARRAWTIQEMCKALETIRTNDVYRAFGSLLSSRKLDLTPDRRYQLRAEFAWLLGTWCLALAVDWCMWMTFEGREQCR